MAVRCVPYPPAMLILTHITALELLRRDVAWERLDTRHCRAALRDAATREQVADVEDALRPFLLSDLDTDWPTSRSPLHILIEAHGRPLWRMNECRWHLWSNPIPAGSFMRVASLWRGLKSRPFLVTSPELTFLMLAREADFAELVRLGYELCGSYRVDPAAPNGFLSHREPLCSPASIEGFCERYGSGVHGVKAARAAAKCVLADSGSPRESAMAALLATTRPHGGQGLPAPVLNARLDLDAEAKTLSGKQYLVVDALWRRQGVGLEYDSTQFHSRVDPMKVESDKRRQNAALRMGVRLLPVTNDQLKDPYRFNSLARVIARELGYRYVPLKAAQFDREIELRKALLA